MSRHATLSLAAMLAAVPLALPVEAEARNDAGAVAAGIIIGAAVGAAVSSDIKHKNKIYVPGPPKPAQAFSPKPGVWCYPAQRACYKAGGAYAANWTYKVYGR
jgi:hypothetical protein